MHTICRTQYIAATAQYTAQSTMLRMIVQDPTIRGLVHELASGGGMAVNRMTNLRELYQQVQHFVTTQNIVVHTERNNSFRVPLQRKFKAIDKVPGIDTKRTSLPSEMKQSTIRHINDKYSDHIKLYTDGSKQPSGSAASAFYCDKHRTGEGFRISHLCSNYSAEVNAVLLALKHLTSFHTDSIEDACILTDSQALVSFLKNLKIGDSPPILINKILELVNLYNLETNKNVYFQWIPAHVEVPKNSFCDKLAKLCTERGELCTFPTATEGELRTTLAETSLATHQKEHELRLQDAGSWTNNILSTNDQHEVWFKDITKGNKLITTINRILYGHANNRYFRYLMRIEQDPICECRKGLDELDHILNECELKEEARARIFDKYEASSFQEILKKCLTPTTQPELIEEIYKYIQENNIAV
ncbi:hypothetical protein GE061_013633 [Apolygus lucorum]|uniref:RNase H type-1 domain-containing protein n=1 Tax=Apolygus lucorum TaxID=248454 RepID=A0A8S9XNH6_APOLU|nr:hypothetical protein GE061_013633 [Apolygus lucorum]